MWYNAVPFFALARLVPVGYLQQVQSTMSTSEWKVQVSSQWDVLGPFPIHAREQQYLSPAFPLNLSQPIDFQKRWPSSYADGGNVGWTTTCMNQLGELRVSFPAVRWKYLRSFAGWAALQHHALLRASLSLTPPENYTTDLPNLLVHLHQGSYFTILPNEPPPGFVPKWYAGNIYDLPRSLPHVVELPLSSTLEYHILVSGDYEIRLFGDPLAQEGTDVPVQNIKINISVDKTNTLYVHEASQDVIPDFVHGFAFGDAFGVGLRGVSSWITVTNATLSPSWEGIKVNLVKEMTIAAGQTRIIPIQLKQSLPITGTQLELILTLNTTASKDKHLKISLPLRHLPQWSSDSKDAIKASFFYASSNPTIFAVKPPILRGRGQDNPPILALHGAGVDVVEQHLKFWADAMPRNEQSWIIMPAGRTSWGLDWHGPSAQEAWGTVSALSNILQDNEPWRHQAFAPDTKVVLIGHSNGGQGVWHMSSHFPDRVIAAVPAAAYIKSQAYIPLTESRSSHYIDPILRAILESSLTPDDNDLHLSNIAHVPLLAVHGGADGNVPSWHSRELLSILHTINPASNASLLEEEGKDHWFSTVLSNPIVQGFIDDHVQASSDLIQLNSPESFTLTVSNPSETGSVHGWKIHSLSIHGRLGILRVAAAGNGILQIFPTNVHKFSIETDTAMSNVQELHISSSSFSVDALDRFPLIFTEYKQGHWKVSTGRSSPPSVPTRLQAILSSTGTINIIYEGKQALTLAIRLAHDLHLHHRLDSTLVADKNDADLSHSLLEGNSVIIGTFHSPSIQRLLKQPKTSFELRDGQLFLGNLALPTSSESYLYLHPGFSESSYTLVIIYSDEASLERAGKLFPIRTGVVAPSWVCISPETDWLGAAGLHGAGVWAADWTFQPASSWLRG